MEPTLRPNRPPGAMLILTIALCVCSIARAQSADPSLPRIIQKDGRFAFLVDGAPYLILGAQVNNSSAWPAVLPKVWPAMELLHVNTVEMPVYWEQMEPQQGHFDFGVVDTLLTQAREHKVHLILLWFGTWKNGSNHYMPQWMKLDPARYPNIVGADGKFIDSPSPLSADTLQADIAAFTALMRHLKEADPRHTVLMVQVENEPGTWNGIRDYSPAAQKLFEAPVPDDALRAMNKTAASGANWQAVFGPDADEFFHVWCVARFIGQVAAAGKAAYPLPLYVNASVRDPFNPGRPPKYECGGPNDNVFPLWKAAAPAVDLLAPDIYQRETARYLKILDLYHRDDNPLFVPESIGQGAYSRFCFAALGRGAIGFSPFGLDYTRAPEMLPIGTTTPDQFLEPTALNYEILSPMSRELAQLIFEGKVQTAIDEGNPPQLPAALDATPPPASTEPIQHVLHFGAWDALIGFGLPVRFAPTTLPRARPDPTGRALVAQLADNQFLVTGLHCHVAFQPAAPAQDKPWQYLSVEEGHYDNGTFKMDRILNGDQTDWGLIFASTPTVLRVTLYMR